MLEIKNVSKTYRPKKGVPVKRQALSNGATVKTLLSILDPRFINEIIVFDGNKEITKLSQSELEKIVNTADLYSPLSKYLYKRT